MFQKWTARIGAGAAIAVISATVGFQAGAQEEGGDEPVQTLKKNEVARVGERVISAEQFIQRLVQREKYITDADERTAAWALDSLLIEETLQLEANRIGAREKPREIREEKERLENVERDKLEETNKFIVEKQKELGKEPKPITWEEWLERKYGMNSNQYSVHLLNVARQSLLRRLVIYYWADATEHADAQGIFMRGKKDIDAIRERALDGEKFEILAEDNSEDMWTRENRGNIGTVWPKDGSLDAPVDEAFWKLEVGEISQPIQTEFGYWIIKRTKNYPGNKAQFFDRRAELIGKPNVKPDLMLKWRRAIAASERYAFERRMPGWDCEADTP